VSDRLRALEVGVSSRLTKRGAAAYSPPHDDAPGVLPGVPSSDRRRGPRASDAETPERAFWTWFVKNEIRLAGALKSDPVAAVVVLAVSAYGNAAVDEPGDGAQDERLPDLLPTQADLVPIGALAPAELEEIDRVPLAHATPRRQKMAMVVAQTMRKLADRLPKIPFVFYAQRVRRLVRLGQLEGFGDLERMRFSEVRLPRAERG
jgi:hypothetical protein